MFLFTILILCQDLLDFFLVLLNVSFSRHAYVQDLLAKKVDEGVEGLEKHGDPRKLDNRTCLWCLGHPDTYGDPASLTKNPVFQELTKLLGISMMHLKVR